jgi:mycobactin polyketide synthetase MbtD
VAATTLRTRRIRKHRTVIRAADTDELVDALAAVAAGQDHPLVARSAQTAHKLAFVFPGQGNQWPSMGSEAYNRLPEYRAEADRCAAAFVAAGHASPLDYLLAGPGAVTNDFTQVQIQGAQFVHGVALARVWRACGVLPDITVGHSLGEIGAAYVAGTITLDAAVGVVAARATLLDGLTGPYRVAVLGLSAEAAERAVAGVDGWAEVSVVNSPSSVAVSGDTAAIAAVVREITGRGAFAREIEMWFPAHTTKLDGLRAELDALLPTGDFAETPVQFIGSATGAVVAAGTDFADYWYTNLRSTVRFDRAVAAAVEHGARTFVELSAHPALLYALGDVLDTLEVTDVLTAGSGRRDEPITDRLAANITAVAVGDPGYRWADHVDAGAAALPNFPFAPMRSEHLWATPQPLPPVAGISVAVEHWEPHVPARAAARRAAIIGGGGDLDAAAAHRLTRVAPADADVLIVVAPALDGTDTAGAAAELGARIETGLLGYTAALNGTDRDVWLVTVNGEHVRPGDPAPLPAHAALGAMHRSLALEFPDHRFGHLDLPDRTLGAAAVDILLGPAGEFAIRDGIVYRRSTRDEPISTPAWTADSGVLDEVVITGGTGVVGLHLARHLADRGARRIVLLSRDGADTATLSELGADIVAPRCDITDPAALAAAVAETGSTAASLVIHAAGSASITEHRQLTAAAFAQTVAAKVTGFDRFAAAWPLRPDARILLCSSVSGLWGGRGHAAYAAANRLLDVQAAQQRAAGRRCTAVRWGLWPGAGIIDADEIAKVQRSGLVAMVPDRAAHVCLRDWPTDPLVFSADPTRLRTFLGGRDDSTTVPAPATVATGGSDPSGAVRAALGAVLKVTDTAALDLAESLLDLGVDSLLALDLRKKLMQATGQKVPLATILGGITGTELIEHLAQADLQKADLQKTDKESTVA